MIHEFKKFLLRGNVLDMAIGVVLGAAFTKIVSSFTSDILMPPVGMLLGKADFSQFYFNLSGGGPYRTLDEAKQAGAVTINYGHFLNVMLDFLIVATAIYLLLKMVARTTGYDLLRKDQNK